MVGERDLDTLRQLMAPQVQSGTYVYCSFSDFRVPETMQPVCTFVEREGLTAIVPKGQAEQSGVPFQFESVMITLTVHSSLEAVGFMAAISRELAARDIPCNVVSAYFHDHLFIPVGKLADALAALGSLTRTQ